MLFKECFLTEDRPVYYYQDVCVNDDLERLGIEAVITEIKPFQRDCFCAWAILFYSEEDLNLYRIAGFVKEQAGIHLMTLDRFLELCK